MSSPFETDDNLSAAPDAEFSEAFAPTSLRLRQQVFIGLGILLVAVGAFFSLGLWRKGGRSDVLRGAAVEAATPENQPSADVALVDEQELTQISSEPVALRAVDWEQETTGKVAFNEDRQTPVFTPYAGRVIEVLANKGDLVKTGQPLLIVESPDLVAVENELSAARADAEKDKIALEAAQKVTDRAHTLFEKEAIAAKDVQQADTDLARAREESRRSQAAVAVAESKLALFGKSKDEIAQLERQPLGSVDQRITIRAPINGTIVERKIGLGQYVKPDTPDPMFLIADLSSLWVLADVYESFLPHIHVGSPVTVSVAAYPERTFPARISFINPTVETATRTVRVRAVVAGTAGLLKPDMFAKIKIAAAETQMMPVVPSAAVIVQNNAPVLFVEEGHGKFRRREVKTGRVIADAIVIESGVKAGERVATRGVLLLNNLTGQPPENKDKKDGKAE